MNLRLFVRTIVLGLLGATVSGCVAGAALAYKLSGTPTDPAQYVMKKQPTVVLVENYHNPTSTALHADRLDRQITVELDRNKVVPVVPAEKLIDLRDSRGDGFTSMNIPAIAKAVGAKQVVYVNLQRFGSDPPGGGPMLRGIAEAAVRVVDADTGKTLWPPDSSAGKSVRLETPYVQLTDGADEASVQEQMYVALGDKIARLFYAAEVDKVDGSEP
jgi:hypothetical protein